MPLVVPKPRYRGGDLVLAAQYITYFGYQVPYTCLTLILGVYKKSPDRVMPWYGAHLYLNGLRQFQNLIDCDDLLLDQEGAEVLGSVYGQMNLDDDIYMKQYLKRVLLAHEKALLDSLYWRAL